MHRLMSNTVPYKFFYSAADLLKEKIIKSRINYRRMITSGKMSILSKFHLIM